MTTKSKKEKPRFLQTQNPRTKAWVKIDSKTGKIISTKKTPGKYKGIKVAKLSKPVLAKKGVIALPFPKKKSAPKVKLSEQTKADIATANARIDQLEANHFKYVELETGKLLPEDKAYAKSLRKRMLEKQFPILKK